MCIVCVCDFFFVSFITFGWQPIHLESIIHFCNFSKQID